MTLYSSPNVENYTLGRGILSMGVWDDGFPPESLTDVGVCNRLELEVTEEKLEHFSRRAASRVKDKIVTLETGYTLNFTLDEMSVENMRAFLRASLSGAGTLHANQLATPEYEVRFISDNAEGPNAEWRFWKVRLGPGGALGLIADDWQGLAFSGDGLADTANHPSSPLFDCIFAGGTTTTTTTSSSTSSTSSSTSTTTTAP